MANFYSYLPLLQQVEGGFQKNPDDPGNYNSLNQLVGTNYGISARFYEGFIGRPPSEADMRAITKSRAEGIFKDHFWDAQYGGQIKNQAMANTIIDHHINSGSGAKLAQLVLKAHFDFNLAADNQIGPITLRALNSVDPVEFVHHYNKARADHYRGIGNATFEAGWLRRLAKFAVDYQQPLSLITIVLITTVGILTYQNLK